MIINKYTFWRKGLFRLQAVLPFTKRAKNISGWLKRSRYIGKIQAMRAVLAESVRTTGHHPLFKQIEIETMNRCNGECAFCPVNRHRDPRTPARMSDELFDSIIRQLKDMSYTGAVHLYSNNEPLLDTRIVSFAEKAHRELPEARIVLYTNGTLLTLELYKALIEHLSLMVIDNYCTDFVFHPNIQEIIEYSSGDAALDKRTRITMRYLHEVMTSRGGLAPNKQDILPETKPYGCLLPLKQMVVRPDGMVSLCCNDALGKYTLGDLNSEGILEVWNKEENRVMREGILDSRAPFALCCHCDTFM